MNKMIVVTALVIASGLACQAIPRPASLSNNDSTQLTRHMHLIEHVTSQGGEGRIDISDVNNIINIMLGKAQ